MANPDIFKEYDIPELLGLTPISSVTDRQIWDHLVTPQVKALLGPIKDRQVTVREQTEGDFFGDHVSNLNDHRLFGGKKGFVRYPFINAVYRTRYGALIIKRDGVKFKVFAWTGKMRTGLTELIFKAALRDRRYDGTVRANDSSLLDFPYDDPVFNSPLKIEGIDNLTSAELSIYGFIPGSRIADATGDQRLQDFVENPFKFIDRPTVFLRLYRQVWKSKRSPGQIGSPVQDVSATVPHVLEQFAQAKGYDFSESAPSHYHVARWSEVLGYHYADPEQAAAMQALKEGIERLKANGVQLTRTQESWVCVLQSLPQRYIPKKYYLGGAQWPQDNIGPQNLWMYKPLSERAIAVVKK